MIEDAELLRRYAEEKSQAAFALLVERQVNFVYACALRRVGGDTHLAEDVTQHVFTALARQASALARRDVLSGWLFTTTRNASAHVVRTERRRRQREEEAHIMNELTSAGASDVEWQRLRPVIDHALDELREEDREAVLLRFFEGKSFADVGANLRLTENTARMRVERALEKLHALLARRGMTSTSAALGVALANQAGVAAPVGLAASVTGAAMLRAGASSAGWLLTFMGMSKLQMGIASALAIAGTTGYVLQGKSNAALRDEIAALQREQKTMFALRGENQRLADVVAEIERLRRDDLELKQLALSAAEAKTRSEENAQLARVQESKRSVDAEVERLNREGDALVNEFKALSAKAKEPSFSTEERAQAQTAAQVKLEAIKAKKAEINQVKASAFAAGIGPEDANVKWEARAPAPTVEGTINLAKPEEGKIQLRKIEAAR